MVFILLIRSPCQCSRPGWAACPGRHLRGWPACTLPTHPHAPPHHLEALVVFTGPGQSSSIRECSVVLILYGLLKAYGLTQTGGSKLLTYWIVHLPAFNQKSLSPSSCPAPQPVPCEMPLLHLAHALCA